MVHSGTGSTNVILSSNTKACARKGAGMPISGSQSLSLVIYKNILGSVYIRRASQSILSQDDGNQSSEEAYKRTECTWTFIPSLFSRCIELRFLNLFGSIQSSLRTYPTISDDHQIWDMCKFNDVEGLQRLFSNRQVSPFSVNPLGWSLLHVRILVAGQTQRDNFSIDSNSMGGP
jgi:type III secretory pathway component EscU